MKKLFTYMWRRRTTTLGYMGVLLSVLELNPSTVGSWVAAPKRGSLLLILAMATAAVGHFNNRQNRDEEK